MPDVVSAAVRSRMMAGIRNRDTTPELVLRKELHRRGFRYRLHRSDLVGKPDLVFAGRRAVIFVHGCFWHGHDCHLFKWPNTRRDFWREKITRNQDRDAKVLAKLKDADWRVAEVWECALKGRTRRDICDVADKCVDWLQSNRTTLEIRGT